jgi:hypothetical protein
VYQSVRQKSAFGNVLIDSSALVVFAEKQALRTVRGRHSGNA